MLSAVQEPVHLDSAVDSCRRSIISVSTGTLPSVSRSSRRAQERHGIAMGVVADNDGRVEVDRAERPVRVCRNLTREHVTGVRCKNGDDFAGGLHFPDAYRSRACTSGLRRSALPG